MKITLNLATRPYADQGPALKRLRIGMLVLVMLLLGLGLALMQIHAKALKMAAESDTADRAIANIQQQEAGYQAQMRQPANARVLQQAEFLNKLFDEKSFSWTAAMEELERVLPAGVQVTAIEPSRGKDGRITLHLRISGDRERSVSMLRSMEHSKRFVSPRISGENAENNAQGGMRQVIDTGNGKVSFDVLSEYNPPTLEERRLEIAAMKRERGGAVAPMPAVVAPPRPPNQPMRPQFNPQANPQFNPQANPGAQRPYRPGRPGQFTPPPVGPNGQPLAQPQGGPQ